MKMLNVLKESLNHNQKEKKTSMENKDSWEEVNNKLIRTYYFKDYVGVMGFVKKVMEIAQKQNHHPDMIVHYDNVKLSIVDHKKNRVTDKCHKLAKSIDNII